MLESIQITSLLMGGYRTIFRKLISKSVKLNQKKDLLLEFLEILLLNITLVTAEI